MKGRSVDERGWGVPGLGLEHRGLILGSLRGVHVTGKEEGGMIAYVRKHQGLGCVKPNHYFQVVMCFRQCLLLCSAMHESQSGGQRNGESSDIERVIMESRRWKLQVEK